MKLFAYTASLFLSVIALSPVAQAAGSTTRVPHIVSASASLNNARFQPNDYSFRLHIAGQALSELTIDALDPVRLSQQIIVTDQAGKKLDTTVTANGQTATIAFTQPVSPDTTIKIGLKGVQAQVSSHILQFSLTSKLVGLNAPIPMGVIRVDNPSLQL